MLIKNGEELIENGLTPRDKKARKIALEIMEKVFQEADPKKAVRDNFKIKVHELDVKGTKFDLKEIENIYVIGGGKASGGMAEVVEHVLGKKIMKGFVNIPDGTKHKYNLSKIVLNEASHPIPNENGVAGSKRILEIASEACGNDLVIVLISGGGSALMPLPMGNLTLDDLQEVTQDLLRSGAVINEINAVRKHL